jgi:hypothetical protein
MKSPIVFGVVGTAFFGLRSTEMWVRDTFTDLCVIANRATLPKGERKSAIEVSSVSANISTQPLVASQTMESPARLEKPENQRTAMPSFPLPIGERGRVRGSERTHQSPDANKRSGETPHLDPLPKRERKSAIDVSSVSARFSTQTPIASQTVESPAPLENSANHKSAMRPFSLAKRESKPAFENPNFKQSGGAKNVSKIPKEPFS